MNPIFEDNRLAEHVAKFDRHLFKVRSAIAERIRDAIRRDRMTHAAAAEITGFGRTVVTAVSNGKIDKISTDRLLKMAARLGLEIHIKVS